MNQTEIFKVISSHTNGNIKTYAKVNTRFDCLLQLSKMTIGLTGVNDYFSDVP